MLQLPRPHLPVTFEVFSHCITQNQDGVGRQPSSCSIALSFAVPGDCPNGFGDGAMAAPSYWSFMCAFEGGAVGRVEVHAAPVKKVARMRDKLTKYAPPHPRGQWPLSANILDPVRCSGESLNACT